MLTHALAKAFAPKVTVNSVAPGVIPDSQAAPVAVTVDNTAVLAAIADLKAHPAVVNDPELLAAVQKVDGHFSGK